MVRHGEKVLLPGDDPAAVVRRLEPEGGVADHVDSPVKVTAALGLEWGVVGEHEIEVPAAVRLARDGHDRRR